MQRRTSGGKCLGSAANAVSQKGTLFGTADEPIPEGPTDLNNVMLPRLVQDSRPIIINIVKT